MKLLLDEHAPHALRRSLTGHSVYTVAYMGWDGTKNGKLLALTAGAGFDAVITTDRGLEHQQNPVALPVAVVILCVKSNNIRNLSMLLPKLVDTLQNLPPKCVTMVD